MTAVDRSRLPAVGPDPPFVFPAVEEAVLPNGLHIRTVERRGLPLLTVLLLLPAGSAADPDDRPGLAAMTADMLDEGSGDRSALDIEDAFARIGSGLSAEVGPDATVLALTTLSRFAVRALELLADVVVRPRLAEQDFTRVRQLRIHRLVQLRDLPPLVAERAFARLVYPDHPYGHLASGTERALTALSLDEVVAFHRRRFVPARATLIIVGDEQHGELLRMAEDAFGGWAGAGETGAAEDGDAVAPGDPAAPRIRLAVVPRPGAAQSEVRVGHPGAAHRTAAYHALLVLNAILGGQFVSRLNMNLREARGLTYGVRSSFDFRRGRGPFVVQAAVETGATLEAVREILAEMAAIRAPTPASGAELDAARAALTRGYPRGFETAEQVARAILQLALYGLAPDHFVRFVPLVSRVTASDVTSAAVAHLAPAQAVVAIVGDHDKIGPSLGGLGLGEPLLLSTEDW